MNDVNINNRGDSSFQHVIQYTTPAGLQLYISRELVININVVDKILPCPFSQKWMMGLVVYQQSVLALIDLDMYLEENIPDLKGVYQELQKNNTSDDDWENNDELLSELTDMDEQSALICKHNEVEFAILCNNVKLSYATIDDDQQGQNKASDDNGDDDVTTQSNALYQIYRNARGNAYIMPYLLNFVSHMSWLDNVATHESASDEASLSAQDNDDNDKAEQGENGNDVFSADLLLVKISGANWVIENKHIKRVETVKKRQKTSPCMPPWLRYFIDSHDTTLPVVAIDDGDGDDMLYSEIVIVVDFNDFLFGIEIENYHLVRSNQFIAADHGYQASIDDVLYDVLDIEKLFDKLVVDYRFPKTVFAAPSETLSFILFRSGDKLCAVLTEDSQRISSLNNLMSLDDSGIGDIQETDLDFKGMIATVGDQPIPAFDISAQVGGHRDENKNYSAIIVVGKEDHLLFGVLMDEIIGLRHSDVDHYMPIDSDITLLKGFLKINNEHAFVISHKIFG